MTYSLLIIAALGAVAMIVSKLARRFIPEIVVFLALGFAIGPAGPLGIINNSNIRSLNLVTQVALGAIIFLIGDRLRFDDLRGMRTLLLPLNAVQLLGTSILVFFATQLAGADTRVAVVLALIAAETGVLTVTATMREEKAEGRFTEVVLSSVGVTNVAVALMFGLTLPFVLAASGETGGPLDTALVFGQIVVASVLIGLLGGYVLRFVGPLIETSGELLLVLLVAIIGMVGAAVAVSGSLVVATLVAGLYVANMAPYLADRLFAVVRTLEAPIYLTFFVVAGASIHLEELATVGVIGLAYLLARTVGKLLGSGLGAALSRDPDASFSSGARAGLGLLPHAGMAIALVAFVVEQAPNLGDGVSAVVLGSIVVFELAGPLVIRRALRSTGEAGKGGAKERVLPSLDTTRTFNRVLVPVGSVEIILPRLAFLFDLVGNMGAQLVAVHVSRPGSGAGQDREPEILRLIRSAAEERDIACTTVHRVSERIAATLVRVSEEQEVDLIVMGEPARSSLLEPSRWGLVAQRVVRDVNVPVLVYPVDPSDPSAVPTAYLRRGLKAQASDAGSGTLPAREPLEDAVPVSPGQVPEDEAGEASSA